MKQPSILMAARENVAYLRPLGRANFETAADFKAAFEALRQRDFRHYVIDLAECTQMDSTFLGILAGSAMKLGGDRPERGTIHLHRPNARIMKLLDDLGVTGLFAITSDEPLPPDYRDAPAADATPATMAKTSLEAHELLMALSPDNEMRFKDVVTFLKEDLARLSPGGA
ncbi:MAG: STAS domain-containing protein [Verrucomicrobiae bacterium]|nr:STAS domain-containing protein [Verrucomicrobiae bacterium]